MIGIKNIMFYLLLLDALCWQEWDNMLQDLFTVLSDKSEDRDDEMFETAKEKITALYGDDADKKTLETLKSDEKFAEISNFLSDPHKTISYSEVCFNVLG